MVSTAVGVDVLKDFATIAGLEILVIDNTTTITEFAQRSPLEPGLLPARARLLGILRSPVVSLRGATGNLREPYISDWLRSDWLLVEVQPIVDVDRGDVDDTCEDGGGIVGDTGCLQVDVFRGPAKAEGSEQHTTFQDEVLTISGSADTGD